MATMFICVVISLCITLGFTLENKFHNPQELLQIDTTGFNTASTGKLNLVIAYCPSYFTMGGALVEINLNTGNWSILTTFDWPSQVCSSSSIPILLI
jgi:hypothetical protein